MTLTEVRVVGGPLSGAVLGLSEPLPELLSGEELQDLVVLPALRAGLAGGEYELRNPVQFVEGLDGAVADVTRFEPETAYYRWRDYGPVVVPNLPVLPASRKFKLRFWRRDAEQTGNQ